MKNLRTYVLCTCMILLSVCAIAQDQKIPINEPDMNKPHLFDNLPDRIAFNPANFTGLLNKQTGAVISTSLSSDATLPFEGRLAAVVSKENGKLQSIVVQSSNFQGASLSITKILQPDGSYRYTGRLISFRHGDLFVLQQNNGQYELVKKNYYDLVNE